jgi:hypothetical protein
MATGNYNNDNFNVDPVTLHKYSTVDLYNMIHDYNSKLTDLTNAWNSMPGSWAGKTADEVQAFFAKYNKLGQNLFGTGKDNLKDEAAGDAILPKIAAAVAAAASNFDSGEGGVVSAFAAFTTPDANAPKDDGQRSPGIGPVTESN